MLTPNLLVRVGHHLLLVEDLGFLAVGASDIGDSALLVHTITCIRFRLLQSSICHISNPLCACAALELKLLLLAHPVFLVVFRLERVPLPEVPGLIQVIPPMPAGVIGLNCPGKEWG